MASASYPDVSLSFSLAMKICAQRKAARRKRARRASPPFFTASHGSLRLVTSHSRFALASVRSNAKNEAPEEEARTAWFARNDPLYQYSSCTLIKRDKKNLLFYHRPVSLHPCIEMASASGFRWGLNFSLLFSFSPPINAWYTGQYRDGVITKFTSAKQDYPAHALAPGWQYNSDQTNESTSFF